MIDGTFPNPTNDSLSREALEEIDRKTREVYEKRIAPYASGISPAHQAAILSFQKLVFTIDYYFEHNEKINPQSIESFWAQSEKLLNDLGMPKDVQATITQDIRDYSEIEASVRKDKKLVDYKIDFFYFKKSCDVRMQRHLIRFLNHLPAVSSADEVAKDIAEEIEDDVDDIEEDKLTPLNGNRFSETLNSKDLSKLQEYASFISSLQNISESLRKKITDKVNEEISKIS